MQNGLVVLLYPSSVPEETGSHVYDKNMQTHSLLSWPGPIFFLPIILFSYSIFTIFSDSYSSFFQLLYLASANIVSALYIYKLYRHGFSAVSTMLNL